jgi:hypothetical protein
VNTLSLHDALPIFLKKWNVAIAGKAGQGAS